MKHTVSQQGTKGYELSYCCSAKVFRYSWSSSIGETTGSISRQANPGSQIRPASVQRKSKETT